jgi:hypothetical protein
MAVALVTLGAQLGRMKREFRFLAVLGFHVLGSWAGRRWES